MKSGCGWIVLVGTIWGIKENAEQNAEQTGGTHRERPEEVEAAEHHDSPLRADSKSTLVIASGSGGTPLRP